MFIISRAFKHRRQVLAAVTANSTSSIKQNIKHPEKYIFLILKRGEADESGMCVKGCGRELRVESRVWKWNWRETEKCGTEGFVTIVNSSKTEDLSLATSAHGPHLKK